jgi:hypothetical protein
MLAASFVLAEMAALRMFYVPRDRPRLKGWLKYFLFCWFAVGVSLRHIPNGSLSLSNLLTGWDDVAATGLEAAVAVAAVAATIIAAVAVVKFVFVRLMVLLVRASRHAERVVDEETAKSEQ